MESHKPPATPVISRNISYALNKSNTGSHNAEKSRNRNRKVFKLIQAEPTKSLCGGECMKLIKEMEKNLPIPAYPSRGLCKVMRKQGVKIETKTKLMITKVFNSGEMGGILCTVHEGEGKVFIASLTHLRVSPDHPLSDEVVTYQKQRIKHLKLHDR